MNVHTSKSLQLPAANPYLNDDDDTECESIMEIMPLRTISDMGIALADLTACQIAINTTPIDSDIMQVAYRLLKNNSRKC
jgi:hypothetical protein